MSRDVKSYTLFDVASPRAIASSTNTSPIEITMSAPHGYITGDKVSISGHLVNTNANGSWPVTIISPTEISLDGSAGNGIGVASGTLSPRSKIALVADFKDAILAFDSDGGGDADMTIKVAGSIQKTPPDFSAPKSAENQYEFIQIMDMQNSVAVDGDDGIVLAGGDVNRLFEVNVNGLQWIALVIPEGTEGEITVKARLFNQTA